MSDHDVCKLHTSVVKIHLVYNCELLLRPLILCCSFFLDKDCIGKVRESILFIIINV